MIHKQIDNSFSDLVACLQRAVSFPGDPAEPSDGYPLGKGLADSLDDFLNMASGMGFRCKNIGNVVGFAEIGTGEKLFGVLCHLDTVPVGDVSMWSYPPLGGVVDGGMLFGRGSIDDKGPAVAALFAMKALVDSGENLNCRFRLILGLDEETGRFSCMEAYKKFEEIPASSFSPDANFPLINAEKGILRCSVSKKFLKEDEAHGIILESLTGGTRTNVVPDKAVAVFSGDRDAILAALEKTGMVFSAETNGNTVKATFSGVPAHAMQPWKGDNAIVKAVAALQQMDFTPRNVKEYINKLYAYPCADIYGDAWGIASSDEVSGKLSCNLATIDLDRMQCRFTMDIRYPVTVQGDKIADRVAFVAKNKMDAVFEPARHSLPLYVPADSDFIKTLLSAYSDVTGEKGYATSTGGGTYCRDMPNSVSFGMVFPGEEERAHTVDECVSLESLKKAAHIYAEAFLRLNRSCNAI